MKPVSKWMIASLGLLTQFAFAAESDDSLAMRNKTERRSVPLRVHESSSECYTPGYPDTRNCFPASYNEPARIDRSLFFSVNASFIYWKAIQEGMDLAINTSGPAGGSVTFPDVASRWLLQDFDYKAGFKVGLEVNLPVDDWVAFAEYTRYRHETSVNSPSVPSDGRDQNTVDVWTTDFHAGFNPFIRDNTLDDNPNLNSNWDLHVDYVDSGLTRPFYQGTHLIMSPFGGLRAQWISQAFTFTGLFSLNDTTSFMPTEITAKSNSWAIGPRGGFLAKWLMKWGLRIEGDVAGALLYTRYNTAQWHANQTVILPPEESQGGKYVDYNALRLLNEMNLGLGWGKYFTCGRWFSGNFDVLVAYDFKIFWNQNMMRQIKDLMEQSGSHDPNHLYLHGLTVRGQLDF